jgi:hypothetical protein
VLSDAVPAAAAMNSSEVAHKKKLRMCLLYELPYMMNWLLCGVMMFCKFCLRQSANL